MLPPLLLLLAHLSPSSPSPLSPPLHLSDVFISVKTSGSLHSSRLPVLLATWLPQAGPSTHLFTDAPLSPPLGAAVAATGARVEVTGCPADHGRSALCCKMQAELLAFLASPGEEAWWCHLDDDNYLHLEALLPALAAFPTARGERHYLGKASIARPLELLDRRQAPPAPVRFRFGTGGAGVCLSRAVVEGLEEEGGLVSGFQEVGDTIRLPDDVTLGYLVETVAAVPLTTLPGLHSHLEPLARLEGEALAELLTASYSVHEESGERNTLQLGQDPTADPTAFLALHRNLHPETVLSLP